MMGTPRAAVGAIAALFFVGGLAALILVAHPRPPHTPATDDAERWFVLQRAFPGREIPAGALDRAVTAMRALTKSRASLALTGDTWVSIGPQPINDPATRSAWSGRVTTVAVHPTDPNTLYIGADRGGVWKSTDAGQTWSMMTPDLPYPAIRSLAIDPVNPDIVYAATQPGAYASRLLRSTDAGRSWQEIVLKNEQGQAVTVLYKVLLDPRRAGSVSASTLYLQRGGWLYRSDDSGTTLKTIFTTPDLDLTTNIGPEFLEDVVLDPAHPDTLFLMSVPYTCTSPCSNPDPAIVLYRSLDGGAHWTRRRIAGSSDVVPETRVAVSSGATNLLVGFRDSTAQKVRLMRSTDMGDTWTELNTLKPGSLAWPVSIALTPGADALYLGNLGLARSTDWGQTWTDTGALHADETVVAFDAANRLLLGSDGGLFRAGTPTGSWASLNGALSITECYSVAAHPTNGARVLIGTQDNGTVELQGAGSWSKVFGGDGGDVVYDPTVTSNIAYIETQWDSTGNYNFYQCTDGSCSRRVSGIATTDVAPFIPRFVLDASAPATLYLTAEHLYRTDNRGLSWTPVTDSVKTSQRCWTDASGNHCANASYFTAVAVAPSSSQVVYAGTLNGDVWTSTNRGAAWKSVAGSNAGPLPVRPVKDIAIDPVDPRVAYVVFGGYDAAGAGRGHVFRTSDGGDTWRDLSGDLPDVNVNALLIDPDAKPRVVYLGTDLGVLRATDDGSAVAWQTYSDGLPPVVVTRFAYNGATRTLLAATYGRGVWAIGSAFKAAR